MASVWVPFTSESKEAIAHYPDIIKEIKLALRDCGRKLASFLRHRERARLDAQRKSIFELYVGELITSLNALTGSDPARLQRRLAKMVARHTTGELIAEEAGIDGGEESAGNGSSRGRGEAAPGASGGGAPKKPKARRGSSRGGAARSKSARGSVR
jgi:DNA topoisomerase-6 subunit B